MNKDLDSRIIPNGEYRNAENISISTSEGSDVGALENIRGNLKLTDFGLSIANLEIIGNCIDTANNRIFFFITNNSSRENQFSSSSGEQGTSNIVDPETGVVIQPARTFTKTGSKHYIAVAQILGDAIDVNVSNISTTTLVSGSFLNFSTLNPILGVNVLEDLLFWTDDRNQPRKINIKRALANPYVSDSQPGYYTNEDHISVAKYAPYTSIGFLKDLISPGGWESGGLQRTTLKNEADEYLPPHVIAPCSIDSTKLTFSQEVGKDVDEGELAIKDFLFEGDEQVVEDYSIEIKVTCEGKEGEAFVEKIPNSTDVYLKSASGTSVDPTTLGWGESGDSCVVQFSSKNPDYNSRFVGDKDLLREKFVRFSYRFKYDDGEYSLTAPFSQHAFIPKQYGYFIGDDDKSTAESSIVDFMENQVTTAGLMIDLPCAPNKLKENLHVEEIQILYKASDEQALKVIADIEPGNEGLPIKAEIKTNGDTGYTDSDNSITGLVNFIEPTGGNGEGIKLAVRFNSDGTISGILGVSCQGEGYKIGDILTIKNPNAVGAVAGATVKITELDSKYFYNYKSQKPIKVLPEKEIVRVSDIVPMRAKTQEVVGNRIVYGNFLQNNTTPSSLNYEVRQIDKGSDQDLKYNQELINHTLKQGRTYQAGIVLQDRYGRASNVIINADNSKSTEFNSTYFSSYTNGGVDPLSWLGNSLNIVFDEKIPAAKTIDYNGTWNETNPLGWYTYKVVVKQQEQDYYNIYTPGSLTGNVVFTGYSKGDYPSGGTDSRTVTHLTYSDENKVAHIALFNDNINKIPRDLNEVGPSDRVYSSSVTLYNRVNNKNVNQDADISYDLSQQTIQVGQQTVTTIRPFIEMGDWTKYKNVNLHYLNMDPNTSATPRSQYPNPTFIYPGSKGDVDPFFLDNNKNPLIATLKVGERIGATATEQGDTSYKFAKSLTIFETKPTKSQIDIYYETSSSDTIANFNNEVDKDETFFSLGGITDVMSDLVESNISGDFISNPFKAVDNNGVVLADSSVTIEIIEVVNSNGTEVIEPTFTISSQGGGGTSDQPSFQIELTKKLVYHASSDTEDDYILKLRVKANNDANELIVPNIPIKLTNVQPAVSVMGDFTSFNKVLFNFNNDPFNGSFYEREGTVSSSENFNAYEYDCQIWPQTIWNDNVDLSGPWLANFEKTSNGSVLNIENLQDDSSLRYNDGSLINPTTSRLRDLKYNLLWTGLETRTCKFNKDTGEVSDIGSKDDDKDFEDKWRPPAPFIIQEGFSSRVVKYQGNKITSAQIPYQGGSYGNSGDKRSALLITSTFTVSDANNATGTKTSGKYITRTIIYKGDI